MKISVRIQKEHGTMRVQYETHELSWWCEGVDAETYKTLSRKIQNSAWFKQTRFEPRTSGRPAVPRGNGFLSMRAKFSEEREIREIESEVSSLLQQAGVKYKQSLPVKCKSCGRAIGGFGLPVTCVYCGTRIKDTGMGDEILEGRFDHLEEFIKRGEFTVTAIEPVGCVAVASDGQKTLAMLKRGKGESLFHLLARLDQAIAKANNEGVLTDEINRSHAD